MLALFGGEGIQRKVTPAALAHPEARTMRRCLMAKPSLAHAARGSTSK